MSSAPRGELQATHRASDEMRQGPCTLWRAQGRALNWKRAPVCPSSSRQGEVRACSPHGNLEACELREGSWLRTPMASSRSYVPN
ncbi:UNVERIFIED_CONTAM: hypothetical protein Slati_2893900 [Sesamum latifolium]|uniref:Uncharacterized protein n=1 Tax=Sesamum latifolium TaxID=2727402 RepID=A0AAW2VD50_9LAMI